MSIGSPQENLFPDLWDEMLTNHTITRGTKGPEVVEAVKKVPRHLFVPKSLRGSAYDDRALPIGEGQRISQPYLVKLHLPGRKPTRLEASRYWILDAG